MINIVLQQFTPVTGVSFPCFLQRFYTLNNKERKKKIIKYEKRKSNQKINITHLTYL